jgi:hypothetical protein
MLGIFHPACRQDGAYGRSWALKRKRTLGGGHGRDDTDVRTGRGELRGFVERSTNQASMDRGRVCEAASLRQPNVKEMGKLGKPSSKGVAGGDAVERRQTACRFIAYLMGGCPWIPGRRGSYRELGGRWGDARIC